jgi:serine phosphatase RsbU (regulator of sigma subunit)
MDTVLENAQGDKVIISGNALAKKQKSGEIWITCIMHDITVRKQNEEIIRQKNVDILDSIVYAQRIQKAILPTDAQLEITLPNSFVMYEPKEIVSGDFYFTDSVNDENNQLAIVGVGDCTGHGVPGAFMSLFAHNFLKRSIKEGSVTSPAQALNFVRSNLLKSFREGNMDDMIYDGMDIAFLAIDFNNMNLQYAGAYRPLFIVRGENIIEIKGDRQPIGYFENMKPFSNHEFKLIKGDNVYIFSDGITDQFGGEKRKKYSTQRFKRLLVEISSKDIAEQEKLVLESWFNWMGDTPQTDDVCLVGFKV